VEAVPHIHNTIPAEAPRRAVPPREHVAAPAARDAITKAVGVVDAPNFDELSFAPREGYGEVRRAPGFGGRAGARPARRVVAGARRADREQRRVHVVDQQIQIPAPPPKTFARVAVDGGPDSRD